MRSAEHSNPVAAEPHPESQDAVRRPDDPTSTDPVAPQRRRLTVVTRYRNHAHVPEIRMGGRWLKRAGFPSGSRLAILVTPGQLVVTVAAPPGPPPARFVNEAANPYCLCLTCTRPPQTTRRARRP